MWSVEEAMKLIKIQGYITGANSSDEAISMLTSKFTDTTEFSIAYERCTSTNGVVIDKTYKFTLEYEVDL
jgi:hypothetical protein